MSLMPCLKTGNDCRCYMTEITTAHQFKVAATTVLDFIFGLISVMEQEFCISFFVITEN